MKFRHQLASCAWLAAGSAFAHEAAGPNGGPVRDAGPYHVELVLAKGGTGLRDNAVAAYVTDAGDRAVASSGLKGRAMLLHGREKVAVDLLPDADNRLKGSARYDPAQVSKAIVSLTLPGGRTVQAPFELPEWEAMSHWTSGQSRILDQAAWLHGGDGGTVRRRHGHGPARGERTCAG